MTRKSISKRIRQTKRGTIMRRAIALGHARSNKSSTQFGRKKRFRGLDNAHKIINKRYL